MIRQLIYSPEALADLSGLYIYIADHSGPGRSKIYNDRLRRFCDGLTLFSERGSRRDDIRPGLRLIGFERRATIAFHVQGDLIIVDRVFYGGRDVEGAMR